MKKPPLLDDQIDQLSAMRAGVAYRELIRCRNLTLEVRPLSMLETLQVANEVQGELARVGNVGNRLLEHEHLARLTLIKATTSDIGKDDPKLTDLIVQKMTPEEISYLHKQYVAVVDKKNPALELLPVEDLKDLVEALKKSPPTELGLHLTELSFLELASLCHALILQGSPQDK